VKYGNKVLELLDNSGHVLRNLLFKITLCEDTADELMQELFLRLATSPAFDHSKNSFAYAWRTAVNLGMDYHRKKRPTMGCNEQTADDQSLNQPLQKLITDEHIRIILCEVAKLRSPAREIVIMRYLEQCDYKEIADLLGKEENYIRSQLSKALKLIRENLNGQLDIQES